MTAPKHSSCGYLTAFVLFAFLATSAPAQNIWYVDVDNCPGPGTGAPEDPFCTIQDGIDAASDGDTVLVADGTYTGDGNRDLDFSNRLQPGETRAITVRSENGPENCIIDCESEGRGFYFHSGEGPDSVVEGFTITNGHADRGGAVYCYASSPTIKNCIMIDNYANVGGGVSCEDHSSPTLTNCTISGNSAYYEGGGVDCYKYSSPTLTNCTISGNSANTDGGGVFCYKYSSPTLTNCTISGNTAHSAGGGVFCIDHSSLMLTNCTITGNTADVGGGVLCAYVSSPTLTNCTISGNTAHSAGGGVCLSQSSPTITNCILWGDSPQEIHVFSGSPVVTYSDIEGGWPGEGNIDADPLFVDPGNGDYRLLPGSPCIDAGDNDAVPPGVTTDLDGNPRFVDDPDTPDTGNGDPPIVDMGAYEFQVGNGHHPTADTFISEHEPDNNYGSSGTMEVRNRYGGDGSSDWERDALIRFDVSAIPPGTSISSATLYLYYGDYWSVYDPVGRDLTCHRITSDWEEGSVTWNTGRPTYEPGATSSCIVPPAFGWMDWDVTGDVQAFVDGLEVNHGWQIMDLVPYGQHNIPVTRFRTREYAGQEYWPLLEVCYTATYWRGATGDWNEASNWTSCVPAADVAAHISNGGTAQITQPGAVCQTLWVGEADGAGGAVELVDFGELSAMEEYIGAEHEGSFTQTGGVNTVASRLIIGDAPGSDGSYTLSGGTLDATGATVVVGRQGTGTFDIIGGTVQSLLGVIGADDAGDGAVTVDGPASSWDCAEQIYVGGDPNEVNGGGHGELSIRNEAIVTSLGGHIGFEQGSQGTVRVTGSGSQWINDGGWPLQSKDWLSIGAQGSGTLHINDGGYVRSLLGTIGRRWSHVGGSGEVYIDGAGSTWECDALSVGGTGAGSAFVQVTNDGHITAHNLYAYSSGTLNVLSGGTLASDIGDINDITGGGPTVTIAGAGSAWTMTNHLIVSNGSLMIQDGGLVSTPYSMIAHYSGNDASVNVDGASSVWTNPSGLYVGAGGTGEVNVSGNATVNTGDLLGVGANGTVNIDAGLVVADAVELYAGAAFNAGWGSTLRVNALSGFGDDVFFDGNLQIGHAGGSGSGSHAVGPSQTLHTTLWLTLGYDAVATFTQTGGTTSCGGLRIGQSPGGAGTYELTGGSLSPTNVQIGYDGVGNFVQGGGTHTVFGGWFELAYHGGSIGTYELSGDGSVSSSMMIVGCEGAGTFTQTGGTNVVWWDLGLGQYAGGTGTYTISAGQLDTGTLYVGVYGSGTLDITGDDAQITVRELLSFESDSTFTAVPGSTIHMTSHAFGKTGAHFENRNTDATALAGLAELELIFEGGPSETPSNLEVACEDKGAVVGGYDNNFALGKLTLGGADFGHVRLVDNTDNGNRGGAGGAAEALYVDTLVLNDGSVLDLNGLHLYYRTDFINNGGTVLNGWVLPVVCLPFDFDCDGDVDADDFAIFDACFTGASIPYDANNLPPGCTLTPNTEGIIAADFDGDGDVDQSDFGILQRCFSGENIPADPACAQ